MKRTLIEILVGLAVIVMMVSINQRVSRLQREKDQVESLRQLVTETAANATSRDEIAVSREEILAQVGAHLDDLRVRLDRANEQATEASFLRQEIEATRRDASLLRAELARDVQRTQQLVDTYATQIRNETSHNRSSLDAAKARIEALAHVVERDPEVLNTELLAPTVQLNGDDTVGSGTLIKSERNPTTGRVENFVITSYHVVRNILADSPRAKTEGIDITIYKAGAENSVVKGRMISYDVEIDVALLELETDEVFGRVARVLPPSLLSEVEVWDSVYALGCPLGNDPIPTTGELSSKSNILNGTNYWMINAPTYYGNSGGGVYLADGNYLIGVFSKIYTHGKGNPIVVPHMGLFTPITAVYEWLEREDLAHAVPNATATAAAAATLAAPPK